MGKQTKRINRKHDKKVHSYSADDSDYGIKQLEHELGGQGLYIKEITGDGNCLFRSLSDQLGESNTHAQIRHEVVTFLRTHADEFSFFVEEDFDAYVDRMSNDGVYGDNLEIVAFARLYRKQVKIYQPGLSYIVKAEDEQECVSTEDMIHIVYHSYEHYSSVRNKGGPHEGAPSIQLVKTAMPVLQERRVDAPASDLEKICLSSVPGTRLQDVREALKACGGNVNAAVDRLLESQYAMEYTSDAAMLPDQVATDDNQESCQSPSAAVVVSSEGRNSDAPKASEHGMTHADGRAKPEAKRISARDKKEQSKRLQKEAARERKRKSKSEQSTDPGEGLSRQTKTINI